MADRPLVIYHGRCHDGFCAAWVAHRAVPEAELLPRQHGEEAPGVDGRDVWIVDFAFDRERTEAMHASARSLTVLDHHQSALAELGDLPYCIFDMARSGAGMAWDHFFAGQPRPWIVDYVEDRDLWRWALPDSRAVNAALLCLPYELDAWTAAAARAPEALAEEGRAVLRYQARLVDRVLEHVTTEVIGGVEVPSVNSTVMASELGNILSRDAPFAAIWQQTADGGRVYSLRSQPDGADVARVAELYGGGGHPRASGFRLKPGERP